VIVQTQEQSLRRRSQDTDRRSSANTDRPTAPSLIIIHPNHSSGSPTDEKHAVVQGAGTHRDHRRITILTDYRPFHLRIRPTRAMKTLWPQKKAVH